MGVAGEIASIYLHLHSIIPDFGCKLGCSESLLSIDHGLNTVVHVLDEVNLGTTQSAEVGDIIDTVIRLSVLTMGTTDLDVVLVGDGLELVLLLGKLGELDVDRGAHASSEVGGAVGDVSKMLVVGELGLGLNLGGSDGESLEDLADVRSLLHRDDTELILLIDPDEESLGVVVEDTARLGPFTLETGTLKILVTTLEKEVVRNKLLLLTLGHGGERVVLTLELTGELVESRDDLALDFTALLSSNTSAQGVVSEITGDTDSSRVDHSVLIGREVGASQLGVVHVRDVLGIWSVSVILRDDLVEERSEGVVALVATSVDTNA